MHKTSVSGAHTRYLQDLEIAEEAKNKILKIPSRSFFRAQEKAIAVMNELLDVNPDQAEKSFQAIIAIPLKKYKEATIAANKEFEERVRKAKEKYEKQMSTIDE